jgi:SAM-dependent methyltransferase
MNWVLRRLEFLPGRVADRLHALKHRTYWLTKGRQLHQVYFDDYQKRSEIIVALRDWLNVNPRSDLRVLEFGCSGGTNLRLMRETVSVPIQYVGFDIQPDAIAFANGHFPNDLFVVGDEKALLEQAPSLGPFDVFLASGVFSYIPESRCQTILSMAARIADMVLVFDDLSRIDNPRGLNDGIFLHPYSRLCGDAGLQIIAKTGDYDSSRYGVFVARPRSVTMSDE